VELSGTEGLGVMLGSFLCHVFNIADFVLFHLISYFNANDAADFYSNKPKQRVRAKDLKKLLTDPSSAAHIRNRRLPPAGST